jgi:hypothetical protein
LSKAQAAATITDTIVSVDEPFLPFVESALARLRYLYPDARFDLREGGIRIAAARHGVEAIARDVSFLLYREKIYAETLPLRRALVEAVTQR